MIIVNEPGSTILDFVHGTCVLAAGPGVDKIAGLGDAVLDGLLVAVDETLSLAL
jgi:hypothetical protein